MKETNEKNTFEESSKLCGMNGMPCKCKKINNLVEIKIQWYDDFGNKLAVPIEHTKQILKKFSYKDTKKHVINKSQLVTNIAKYKYENDMHNTCKKMLSLINTVFEAFAKKNIEQDNLTRNQNDLINSIFKLIKVDLFTIVYDLFRSQENINIMLKKANIHE